MVQLLYPDEVHVADRLAPAEDVSAPTTHVHQIELLSPVPVSIIIVVVMFVAIAKSPNLVVAK